MDTSFAFWLPPEASSATYVQKKIVKKFCGIWASFGTDFIENQKQAEKDAALEQRKLFIKPYLDTRHKYFNQNAKTEENDRIVEIEGNSVRKIRYNFTESDKHLIGVRQSDAGFVYLQYIIRNIGLGSAIDVNIVING